MANTKTRWSKEQYRRHVFNHGRGVRSPHEVSNTKAVQHSGRWTGAWELNAEKEYEQNTMPETSWFKSDSADREAFRKRDRREVRKAFADALGSHHFARHKKVTQGQLDKIVDAYMSQDDDKFKSTLSGMGIRDKDADRWRRAAEESASNAIEGTEIKQWDDDNYAAGQQPAGQQPAGQQPAGQQPAGPKNGTSQKQSSKDPPLIRRGTKAPADPAVTPVRKPTTSGAVSVDGVPDFNQTEVRGKLEATARNKASVLEANSNTARKDAQYAEQQADRARESRGLRDRMERADDFERWRSQRNERIRQERADTRYKNRTLSNREDWENLGREGSNRRDYTRKAEGETDEQFNAAVADRNSRLAALRKRVAEMTDMSLVKEGETTRYNADTGKMEVVGADGNVVTDAGKRKTTGVGDDGLSYANQAYANAPGRMRQVQEMKKLMESAGDNITDAQMEAIGKGLDKWQGESDARVANQQVRQKLRDTEQMWRLRDKYGMNDRAVFSDDDVRGYHEEQQKAARTEVLRGMQVAPGITSSGKPEENIAAAENMQKFADGYQKLLATGFDPQKAFQTAMQNADNKKAYMEGLGTIAQDDPDRADKVDQLRRRFIMNQAMQDHGIKFIGGQEGIPGGQLSTHDIIRDENGEVIGTMDSGQTLGQAMAANLPGGSILSNGRGGNAVVDTANREVAKAETAAAVPPAPGLAPRKKDETQQAAKGGGALRPRRRR